MGLRADTVTSSSPNDVTAQPDVEAPEADIPGAWHDPTGGRPETGTEAALLAVANLTDSRVPPQEPAGPIDEITFTTEEEREYDLCLECTETLDDDYVLVARGQQASSHDPNKCQGASRA
ncbi:unnamed protein product [Rhizoctonia solani]|uniref:Uncharacterized protein n=1 Tax=Rhizoctonia solani TaxID=456999 RepID=A0A8H3CT64_9AGAM|nr:unnamed protein product [Rhizoctonia solani]